MAFRETAHFSGGDFRELELEMNMLVCEDCTGTASTGLCTAWVGRKSSPLVGAKGGERWYRLCEIREDS